MNGPYKYLIPGYYICALALQNISNRLHVVNKITYKSHYTESMQYFCTNLLHVKGQDYSADRKSRLEKIEKYKAFFAP
jgi:hypothetical protein